MKKLLKWLGIFLLALIILGLFLINRYGPTIGANYGIPIHIFPPSAERYGNIAIEIMDSNGYYAAGEDWETQKEEALAEFETISSYEEAFPIIEESLQVAGGKHSFLLPEDEKETTYSQDQMPIVEKTDSILTIHLPAIMNAQENGQEYAEIVLNSLRDNQDIEGVILDLQDNTGGDMGPMITAISPLLPDGDILSFSRPAYDIPVTLEDGQVTGGGTTIDTDIQPFKLDVPIAVLVDDRTASSAEAVLMSLMELEQVKTFGQPTAGYASANASYPLYDESIMFLTVAYNKTTSGQIFYDNPIPVDVETEQPYEEAINWLSNMTH